MLLLIIKEIKVSNLARQSAKSHDDVHTRKVLHGLVGKKVSLYLSGYVFTHS